MFLPAAILLLLTGAVVGMDSRTSSPRRLRRQDSAPAAAPTSWVALDARIKSLSAKVAGKRLTDSILGLDGKALAKGELYSNFIKAGANDGDMRAFPRNTQLALASNYEAIAAARLAHSSAAAAPSGKFLKEAAAAVDGIDRTYTAAKSALDEAAGAASEQPGAFRPLPNTGDIRPHVDPVGELVHCSKRENTGKLCVRAVAWDVGDGAFKDKFPQYKRLSDAKEERVAGQNKWGGVMTEGEVS